MGSSSNNNLSDNQLVERFRHSHDNQYVGQLFNRYSHLVLGLCIKYFKDQNQAEDAVMNIFELLIKELKKHDIEYFKSWLYMVSKNYCLQEIRKRRALLNKKAGFELFFNENVELQDELHLNVNSDKEKLLQRMEASLPLLKYNQRQCIKMFYLDNKTYADISEETGYSLKEIKSYIQNGKRNLKIKMIENSDE